MPANQTLRSHIGTDVAVDRADGEHVIGRLLNVGRRTLWLVSGDEDRFVPLDEIVGWHLASAA